MKTRIIYNGVVEDTICQTDSVRGISTYVLAVRLSSVEKDGVKEPWDNGPAVVDFDYMTNGESNSSLDIILRRGDEVVVTVATGTLYNGKTDSQVVALENRTKHVNFREL